LVTAPDFVFTAADIVSAPATGPTIFVLRRTVPHYQTNAFTGNLAGPGILGPSIEITYNKVGPIKINVGTQFLDERTSVDGFIWASYDASTNTPIVYPNGTDIANLESQVLLQVYPATLPPGTVGQTDYIVMFTASGGVPSYTPPFSWSLSPSSQPLPTGFTLASNGLLSTVSPLTSGGSFTIRLTDSLGNTADRDYSITVSP
jgi:hypothetical protein